MLLKKEQFAFLIVIRHRLTAQGNGQAVLDHRERGARLLQERLRIRPPGKIGRLEAARAR